MLGSVMAGCFFYIMLITSGLLYDLAASYGFDFSNRMGLFSLADGLYEWSLFFPGNGFGSTGKYIYTLFATAIHNDVLVMYIDLGFIGSFLWFFWNIWCLPKIAEKHCGYNVSFVYSLLMSYSYIVYLTDNSTTYFMFQTFMQTILLLSVMKNYEMSSSLMINQRQVNYDAYCQLQR